MTEQPPDRILRLNAVLDCTDLTRATFYRKIQQGTFPRQVRIAMPCARWCESAVSDWAPGLSILPPGNNLSLIATLQPSSLPDMRNWACCGAIGQRLALSVQASRSKNCGNEDAEAFSFSARQHGMQPECVPEAG